MSKYEHIKDDWVREALEEYKDKIDVLNITPGPVITCNTKYLNSIPFSIDCKSYVENIFTL